MVKRMLIGGLTVLFAGVTIPARADLIVSIESINVTRGGTGTFDVWISSNASSTSPDQINNYGFDLQITNNGSDNTQLAFSTTQDLGYLTNPNLSPGYVFLGDSFDAQPPSFAGSPSTAVYPNDTFIGSDSTYSGDPVSLSSGDRYLLASLTVTASTLQSPIIGDSFTVSLVPASGDGSMFSDPSTYFDNYQFDTGNETSATPFTSTSGTLTIVAATVVDEPSSIILGLIGILILGAFRAHLVAVKGPALFEKRLGGMTR